MDLQQFFGSDLTLDSTGNLAVVDGIEQTKEALIRRLLTNPESYIWHPDYGAGIGRFIGENLSTDNYGAIKSTIISQILLEPRVAKTPAPQISFEIIQLNILQVSILYYDSLENIPVSITFQVQ